MNDLKKIGQGHFAKIGTGFTIRYSAMNRLWTLAEHGRVIGLFRRMEQAEHHMNGIEIDRIQRHRHVE